jgi:hypothetical protein
VVIKVGMLTMTFLRFDKKCGKSGIAEGKRCNKLANNHNARLQQNLGTAISLAGGAGAISAGGLAVRSALRGNFEQSSRYVAAMGGMGSVIGTGNVIKGKATGNKKLVKRGGDQLAAGAIVAGSAGLTANSLRRPISYVRVQPPVPQNNTNLESTLNEVFPSRRASTQPAAARIVNYEPSSDIDKKVQSAWRTKVKGSRASSKPYYENKAKLAFSSKSKNDSALTPLTLRLDKSPAWQRKEGKNPEGGLNAAGIASYRKQHPGSKLSLAVTTDPSKLKPGSARAERRRRFCARMSGMKRKLTSAKTANNPDSRINKTLRKWNC